MEEKVEMANGIRFDEKRERERALEEKVLDVIVREGVTYGDVMSVLAGILEDFKAKGRNLLDDVEIQEVSERERF